jgi:hypothetical protein
MRFKDLLCSIADSNCTLLPSKRERKRERETEKESEKERQRKKERLDINLQFDVI